MKFSQFICPHCGINELDVIKSSDKGIITFQCKCGLIFEKQVKVITK